MGIVNGLVGDRNIVLSLGESPDGTIRDSLLQIELNIFETTENSPVLGILSEKEQTGWLYDKALVIDQNFKSTTYSTWTGELSSSLKEGTINTDWQSGSINDCLLNTIDQNYYPVIDTGEFSIYSDIRKLYSDYSVCSFISSSEENSWSILLEDNFVADSIKVYSLKRNTLLQNIIDVEYTSVSDFTADSYLPEFKVIDNYLYLNKSPYSYYGFQFGLATEPLVKSYCIALGSGTSSPKDFFLSTFPIIEESFSAFICYEDGSVEKWGLVENFDFAAPEDAVLVLNKDLGVVSCGGFEYDDLIIKSPVSDTDTEIEFFTTSNINTYPTRGFIDIGYERIVYTDRTHNKFKNCIRGHNSTISESYEIGTGIKFPRRGYPITSDGTLYVSYTSTVRVEYEISNKAVRTSEIDVRPSSHPKASQIVQISSRLSDLDSIILESDKNYLGLNRYGPLYFGNDVSRLTATALDSEGNPVDNLEISIEILSPVIGLLDGENTTISKISNSDGKIFSYYNSPIDIDDYSTKYNKVSYSSGLSIFEVENLDSFSTVDDIYLFQLLKHDPSYGTNGECFLADSSVMVPPAYSATSSRPGSAASIRLSGSPGEHYKNGIAYCIDSIGTIWTREISQIDGNYVFLKTTIPVGTIEKVYLTSSEDLSWDPELLNGVPVILYKYSLDALHPITKAAGAYSPIRPKAISGNIISYQEVFPDTSPEDRTKNLGGYMIISPVTVSLRAYAIDPYSGETIYSNTISLTIKLPSYLTGVDLTGALPVPKGFNFVVDEENVGNGLGGVNFISINKSGGIFGLQLRFNS